VKLVNLEKERLKRGWTQEEVATKVGAARSTYANWESGKREPDLATAEKLADLFEVSVDYLMGRSLYRTQTDENSIIKEPEVQFIMRAKKDLTPKQFKKMMEIARKAKEMFEDDDDN
jgi:transcriptional regulator with XRE-family HTH domain